jgi:hypothetical protein
MPASGMTTNPAMMVRNPIFHWGSVGMGLVVYHERATGREMEVNEP